MKSFIINFINPKISAERGYDIIVFRAFRGGNSLGDCLFVYVIFAVGFIQTHVN